MPTNTSGGTTTSFTNTPQAQTDSYAAGEDSISYFDVMANDLGGNAKVLWSIDDTNLDGTSGTTGTGDGTLDLTIKDAVGVCNYSDLGARMWITSDGRVAYDTSTFNYLAAGQTATDHFTYAIRLANGTLSWTTVTVTVTGVNDGPDIKVAGTDSASAGLMETDGSLSANGTLTVLDPDTTDTVNIAVTGLTVGGTGGAGSLTTADLLAMLSLTGNSNNAADGTPGSLGWHFNSGNQAFDYLAAGQTLVLTYTLTGTDGHGGSDTQQVSVTITGTNDAAVIGDPAVHEVTEDVAVTSGNLTATGTLAISDADTGEAHFSTTVTGDPANLGSLTLAADGSYSYSVANAAVQFLAGSDANGGTSSHVDTFTVTAADGTTKQVSFTIHGANDAAVIGDVGVTDLAVTEAGGDHNATAGDPDASGTLSVADTDTGENHFVAVPPSSLNGTYGTFTFSDVTGAWTYTLDNDRPATQVLNQGDPVTDTLTVHSADGTAHDIVVNITGANDAAVITEAAVADHQLVEAGGIANGDAGDSTAGGTLGVSDVDDGESHFLAAASADLNGTYGTFSFDASSGAWTYTLDNDRPATQALNAGDPATDTLVVHSADGTPHTITVNIIGANDAAVISEASGADHDLTEAGGIANAEAGDATAGGTLSVTDVDDGENHFVAPATGSLDGTYGTFTFNESTGAWSYTLDNGRPATQAVVQDQHVTDTLTVHSADGTPHDIIVNITGTNDVAIITQAAGADESLVEAGGVNNGMPGNSTAGGTLSVSDVDAGQSYFVAAADLNGTYGTFTFNQATGAWTYTLDNDRGATQALNGGDPAQDTLTVHSADGTAHDIVVNITGANDAAVITEAAGADHDLVEAGGIGNADAADSSASGTLSVSDVDDGESSFQSAAPGDLAGTYGTFAFNEATGAWTYTLDNDRPATQALNDGAPATDTLTVRSADGTTHDIIVNITGANDAAVITEGAGGDHNLIEAGGIANADAGDSAASGTLSVSDVDAGQGSFVAAPAADLQGTYGTFTFDESTGAWTYTLDNDSTATQALVQDEHATDTLTVHSADGTAHDVVVNITGANDAAVITETAGDDHAVTEAGGTANGTAGDPDAAGTLHVTDVDAGQSSFQAAGDLEGTYGTFTFDETSGAWTYTLDNERAATQALNLGDPAQDSLMVHSADGTAYTVTVDITGSNDAPVVTAALTSLADEGDTSYNLDLLHDASDVDDGETATLSVTDVMYSVDGGPASVTAPAGVSLSGSSLTVDPTNGAFDHLGEGQHATITVTYDVTDAHGATVPQSETITITGTNDAPVVSAGGTLSYTENDAAAAIDAGLTITDVDSAMLSGATVSITGGFATGEDVLGFVAQNGISGSYNAATGVLTLTGPASVADYEAALQSVTYANSSDNPSGATRTISFQVDDGATLDHASNIATASVNVTPVNDAPTSSAVSLTAIAEDSGARLITQAELLANAADVDGPPLSATDLHVASGSGTLVDNHDGTWSYTPSLNDDTSVSFSYTVTDGSLTASGSASLDITPVNDAPVASPVTLTAIAEDSGAHIITQADLLAGVTDVDNTSAELTVTALSIGSGSGSLVDNGNGTWTYTPAADDDGSVSFSYTVSDGQLTASSTATLDITPVNDAPVATVTQATYGATEQVTLHLHGTGLSISDVDAGAGSLTVTLAVTEGVINIFAGTTGAGVSNSGTSSVTITGTLTQINDLLAGNGGATVNYFDGSDTPAASATLSLTVHDNGNTGGGDLSSSATATINITPVNDAPVATIAHTYGVIEQHNLTIHGTGLSISDVDAGSGSMTVTLSVTEGVLNVAAGTSGALVSNSGSSAVTITGSQSQINDLLAGGHSATVVYNDNLDNPSSSVTLTLAAHDNGNTGGGDLSSSATTTITVAPVNDAPVATPVTLTAIAEDSGARTITQAELLAGASDVDNAATDLSITALSITSGSGTLIDNGNHTWTYTPALNDDTGVTFNYTVSDGSLIGTSTASLDITPVNDAAVITGATSGSVTEDAVPNTVTGDLNSTDVDGTADSWTVVSSPTASASGYGTYTIDATGHWTYALDNSNTTVNALNNGATLSDSFTVTTADGTSQVVSVTINGHTDATDVLPPTDIVFGLAASTGTLTGNGINSGMTLGSLTAVDADSTTWTFAIGSVTGQTLPAISLSPATGASVNLVTSGSISSGKYAFSVTATDPAGHSYTETYTLSVGQQQGDGSSAFTITNGTSATNGTDISLGLNGGDTILGGGGDDALVGGNGDDFIHGGLGNDQLIGGQGNDQFFFDTALGTANVDTIFDFNAGGSASNQAVDTVQLDHTIFSALSTGALQAGVSFVSNNTGAASGTHAQIIFNSSTGDLSYDSDGTGAQGAVLFAHLTLTGLTGTLDASDFNVI